MVASIIPDADVISFYAEISYASEWGHRGFTHPTFDALTGGGLGSAFFWAIETMDISYRDNPLTCPPLVFHGFYRLVV